MGRLSQYAKENSQWLKLNDGESYVAKYLGYEFQLNRSGKHAPCYRFRGDDGRELMLQSQGQALALFFDEEHGEAKVGDVIQLTRTGKGQDTRYEAIVKNDIIL